MGMFALSINAFVHKELVCVVRRVVCAHLPCRSIGTSRYFRNYLEVPYLVRGTGYTGVDTEALLEHVFQVD